MSRSSDSAPANEDPLGDIKKATVLVGGVERDNFEPLGSGFVYVHTPIRYAEGKSEPDEQGNVYYWAQVWLVTCKHVLRDVEVPAVRINNKRGGTDIYPVDRHDLWSHPTEDVIVAPLPATKTLGGRPSHEEVSYIVSERDAGAISHRDTAGREQFRKMNFVEQTPVSVVGYPDVMIEGARRDYPLVRAGQIAQVQGFIEGDPAHRAFLVEGSFDHGNSGGPVVVAKGTPSLDRQYFLSDSVVVGMVSHKLDAETQYETGETRKDTARLARIVSMDSVNETIESRLLAARDSGD